MKTDNSTASKDLKQKITDMVNKIDNETLLNRIYRFVKYIYIYKA